MTSPDPMEHLWWLSSRAAGIVALLSLTLSVGLGLAMAGRAVGRPWLHPLHQQTALVGLVAIAVHGITLVGDAFLHPSLADIAIPFRIEHERTWTALGVVGGWLAAILGLSYWLRDRLGPARWRAAHRATILVYALSVAHTLGAGSDAGAAWMRVMLLATGAPVLFLLLVRVLPAPGATRRARVVAVDRESPSIVSVTLSGPRGARPGQHVVLHLPGCPPRPYSVSGPGPRISVKLTPQGATSPRVHALRPGDEVRVAGPRGDVVLDPRSRRPLLLLSAGIGITPCLGMLHALASRRDPRPVFWVHSTREPAFGAEVDHLLARLPDAHRHVRRSDAEGRLDVEQLLALGVPRDAEAVLCGPASFLDTLEPGLRAAGLDVRCERFGGAPPPPAPRVEFRRSGVVAAADGASLLELAEAHAVPTTSGCRAGACGACRVPVLAGAVRHEPAPAAGDEPGTAVLCCARADGDVVLDA